MADSDFDVIVLGLGPGGEDVAGTYGPGGPAGARHGAAAARRRVPLFRLHPVEDDRARAPRCSPRRAASTHWPGTPSYGRSSPQVADRIRDEATDDWDDRVAVERFEGQGGTSLRAAGRLAGRDADGRLVVAAGERTYRAPTVVVATGTAPALPPIDGWRELRGTDPGPDGPVWTNREILRARSAGVAGRARRRRDRLRAGAGLRAVRFPR